MKQSDPPPLLFRSGDYGGLGMDGGFGSPGRLAGRDGIRDSRTLTWDRNPKPDRSDPKYFPVNSLPRQRVPNTTLSPLPRDEWSAGGGRGDGSGGYNYGGGGGGHPLPPAHRDLYAVSGGGGGLRDMPPPMHALPSYQPPPPVVTEQPRLGKEPTHFREGPETRE
jgi:hypothetical protein